MFQILQLLCYLALAQHINDHHHHGSYVVIESFTENAVAQDVALFESSDEEVYDIAISDETVAKINELSLACKDLYKENTCYVIHG